MQVESIKQPGSGGVE